MATFTYSPVAFTFTQDFSAGGVTAGNLVGQTGWAADTPVSANSPLVRASTVSGFEIVSPAASDCAAKLVNAFLGLDIQADFNYPGFKTAFSFTVRHIGGNLNWNSTDCINVFFGDIDGTDNNYWNAFFAQAGFDVGASVDHFQIGTIDSSGTFGNNTIVAGSWATTHILRIDVHDAEQQDVYWDGVLAMPTFVGEWANIQSNYPILNIIASGTASGIALVKMQVDGRYNVLDTVSGTQSGTDIVVNGTFDGAVSFQISRDGGAFTTQTLPKTYAGDAVANHTYTIRAYDGAGGSGNILAASLIISTYPLSSNTLTSNIYMALSGLEQTTVGATVKQMMFPGLRSGGVYTDILANGTGNAHANLLGSVTLTLTAGVPQDIDLTSITGAGIEYPVSFTGLKGVLIQSGTGSTGTLLVGDSSGALTNAFTAFWDRATEQSKIGIGGGDVLACPAGYTVDATHRILRLAASTGTVVAQLDLIGTG